MPPKSSTTATPSPETVALIDLFRSIGLTQANAAEAAKSPKSAVVLKELIELHGLPKRQLDERQGVLLSVLAGAGSKLGTEERGYTVDAILDGRLKSVDQVNGECPFCTFALS